VVRVRFVPSYPLRSLNRLRGLLVLCRPTERARLADDASVQTIYLTVAAIIGLQAGEEQ
jgi:hypothetical protein